MKKRAAGVTIVAALFSLGGAMGLLFSVVLLVQGDRPAGAMLWAVGGVVLALLAFAAGWGLWNLKRWARSLAIAAGVLALLAQIGSGLIFVTGNSAPLIGLLLFAGAAINALAVGYLTRRLADDVPRDVKPNTTMATPLPTRKLTARPQRSSASDLFQMASMDVAPHAAAWLVARSGPQSGQLFLLDRERNTIGRDPGRATIKVDDPLVSRQHAQFNFEEKNVLVYDLASTNGTFVNNRRVQMQTLHDGDVVRVGQTEFVFKQRE
jgi:hypothetical protein